MRRSVFQQILDQCGGTLHINASGTVYDRVFLTRRRLILLGGGHVSAALCHFASELDFDVTVVDDRITFANAQRFPEAKAVICDGFASAIRGLTIMNQDFIATLTRGHSHDLDCLREILKGEFPHYLGLIGSRRRTIAMFNLMEDEGYPRELLSRIHTPIGIPIESHTPMEIAISILAELIDIRNTTPKVTDCNELELTDVPNGLLQTLATGTEPCVLATVIGTSGSTPVGTGALMTVTRTGETCGTVGGGCGEHQVVMESMNVLQSGHSQQVEIEMSNDIAAEEAMVCGGRMSVWLEVISDEDHP